MDYMTHKDKSNTRRFSLFPFWGLSLKKPFCQPFVNFAIGRMARNPSFLNRSENPRPAQPIILERAAPNMTA